MEFQPSTDSPMASCPSPSSSSSGSVSPTASSSSATSASSSGYSTMIDNPAIAPSVSPRNLIPSGKAVSRIYTVKLCIVPGSDPAFKCIFCKSCRVDEVKLGPLYFREGVVTHYYCMLFSAALRQRGLDQEGILGFLTTDVVKEVRRSQRLKCVYCKEAGASVGCCHKKCRVGFHFPCGLENGANYHFHSHYESFCQEHHKRQVIPIQEKDWVCPICIAVVTKEQNPIMSSCCKSAVYHKECMQKVALSAGYFFKCPTCNAVAKFVQEMRSLGIFVPQQDASWESENAFRDLYVQYSNCDAESCACPKGRDYDASKGNWILARCRLCGAAGTHRLCSNLTTVANWACHPCLVVEEIAEKNKSSGSSQIQSQVEELDRNEPNQHVSARSVNRLIRSVRTVRRRLPVQAKEEVFDLTRVTISQKCFAYFPYTSELLKGFKKKNTLPDWRKLSLSVNLTRWVRVPFHLEKPVSRIEASPSVTVYKKSRLTELVPKRMPTLIPRKKSVKKPLTPLVLSIARISKSLTMKRKRNKRKRSGRWSRGVIGRRGKSSKKARLETVEVNDQSPSFLRNSEQTSEHLNGSVSTITDNKKATAKAMCALKAEEPTLISETEFGERKLPPIPIRRRKQSFPSDTRNRKSEDKNGMKVDLEEVDMSIQLRDVEEPMQSSGSSGHANLNSTVKLAGHVLKMNVDYDMEVSSDGLNMRIDESENSGSPVKKLVTSRWKPLPDFLRKEIRRCVETANSASEFRRSESDSVPVKASRTFSIGPTSASRIAPVLELSVTPYKTGTLGISWPLTDRDDLARGCEHEAGKVVAMDHNYAKPNNSFRTKLRIRSGMAGAGASGGVQKPNTPFRKEAHPLPENIRFLPGSRKNYIVLKSKSTTTVTVPLPQNNAKRHLSPLKDAEHNSVQVDSSHNDSPCDQMDTLENSSR